MKKFFYITTTAPYVNAKPHIGFALEIVQADVLARFKREQGYEVAFGFGTDEHGLKIYRKALEEKKGPQIYCDEYAKKFDNLKTVLNVTYTHFIRTTDPKHIQATQEFWKRCYKKGDIYKKNYRIKYCVGCELEKTDSELENNSCPLHPNLKIEVYDEENYFFRFSKYEKKLLELYEKVPEFVIPNHRLKEIKTFVEKGLVDFSISRLKNKMPWGVAVPDDSNQVMYVWFDALIFYISNIGWPNNQKEFNQWWPVVQVAGKDNLRQQTAIWQAMLMSAGLKNSKQIMIHGFITANGQKMSKSLGNVIDPFKLVKKYGSDVVRYYLLREIPTFDDGDYSDQRMLEIYNSELANELGNLVSRLTTLAEKDELTVNNETVKQFNNLTIQQFNNFQFNLILEGIWKEIKSLNKQIDDFAPWKKSAKDRKDFLLQCFKTLKSIGWELQPFLPETADKILQATQGKIKKLPPLFPRL
ncbi:methionine--tRNA ligase [Candidatus Roizmanbacteria bacterium CG02_land_8_20_14_3_00_36_15]|uniref:methionine--tRNA ligase n=2 Tax=Candidatus Roizmaniibacteriota TaxID=1752723 RepID=A0A2M8KJW4_9BACT|nr:MAG: methionine--tRNA ligase [Candidatus Roizmanbacteria bacterium CG03_land_8_20_14_0_80_36_21]PIV37251.1 MAG: methionine--tRNA ligase [Candidatus Roizmanbacteria bacterium CG02_land_8_20_14_3_00_36_15]PIY69754.1 MAG: methionine--tRNA ligase [Candidatus Roizmanbacteria bacterium CG_4_10_14_0_8_um_filter_36_36]PJA53747.1 MAG: methionine--tRNA ligase [Candidatus Roizmanbacteria bacterium CG_4_9_14_3_um_filter_36_11]PJC82165.1 MAG: methionine--tRNA ligase [Candidatus Roizmanbacteria bacterium 